MKRAAAAALGLLADRVVGDPPDELHPTAWFGRLMQAVERRAYRDSRRAGLLHAATGVAVGTAAGLAVRSTTLATCAATGGRSLHRSARAVGDALEAGDVARARALLPTLVGRDPSGLDEKQVARAVVESVAENTVDAIVAPALWAAVGGAPGALVHRAVNTMDAMVGHRSERYDRYGWASARLDDALAWVPARATAALVAACRPRQARDVWEAVRTDAPAHPSPNSGVAEAAFAAALGLWLGGELRYGTRVEVRTALGSGRAPEPRDIEAAVRLSRDVTALLAALLLAGPALASLWSRSVVSASEDHRLGGRASLWSRSVVSASEDHRLGGRARLWSGSVVSASEDHRLGIGGRVRSAARPAPARTMAGVPR